MTKQKDVLTTGQVARICNVAPRTVSKWFDTGQLRGYRIPGSKDRRIPIQSLIRFMKAHGMPLNGLESGRTRLLILDQDQETLDLISRTLNEEGLYDVRTAQSAFEAGAVIQSFRPHVVVVDISLPDVNSVAIARLVTTTPELQGTRLIATSGAVSDGESQALRQQGFSAILRKPFDLHQLVHEVAEALGASA